MINDLKSKYIGILQEYTNWGKSDTELEEDAEKFFPMIVKDIPDYTLNSLKLDLKIRPKTSLLSNTNNLLSPIQLDNQLELPLVELFFDSENFVVYTTQNIYSRRDKITTTINYKDIIDVDDDSIQKFFFPRRSIIFKDLELVTRNQGNIPIILEHGITVGPIIRLIKRMSKFSHIDAGL